MKNQIEYTEVLKDHISATDFSALLEKAQGNEPAMNNLRAAAAGGQSIRSLLADSAKLCGSDFRPHNWM